MPSRSVIVEFGDVVCGGLLNHGRVRLFPLLVLHPRCDLARARSMLRSMDLVALFPSRIGCESFLLVGVISW